MGGREEGGFFAKNNENYYTRLYVRRTGYLLVLLINITRFFFSFGCCWELGLLARALGAPLCWTTPNPVRGVRRRSTLLRFACVRSAAPGARVNRLPIVAKFRHRIKMACSADAI